MLLQALWQGLRQMAKAAAVGIAGGMLALRSAGAASWLAME